MNMKITKEVLDNSHFHVEWNQNGTGLTVLRRGEDVDGLNFLAADKIWNLGDFTLSYTLPDGRRQSIDSRVVGASGQEIEAESDFYVSKADEKELIWEISLRNVGEKEILVDDLKLPLPMNTQYVADAKVNYTRRLVRHAYVSGNASVLYWQRPDGVFPALVMLCGENTSLIDFELDGSDKAPGWWGTYSVCIHAKDSDRNALFSDNTHTRLKPREGRTFRFCLRWAESYEDIRNITFQAGRPDVISLPGMVIPQGMDCTLAVRHRSEYRLELPAFVTCLKDGARNGYDIYRLSFEKTGRYPIAIRYADGYGYLDYFATEAIEDLLKIRAHHVATDQQYRGESWYDGLISIWNMETERMLTPDYQECVYAYCTGGADDPGLCKASVIAAKNCYYPCREEIEAVEYYVERFLWGGLQRRDNEQPYPYGLYGSNFWIENRNSDMTYGSGGHGQEHMWRTFDYTHIIGLYRDMYLIARKHPEMTKYLDWRGYLMRAYHTAMAFYEVPYDIYMKNGWAHTGYCDWAFKQGNFHEINVPWLIEDLEREGYPDEAASLRHYWEQKVMYMLEIHPYPFGSEMWFDSTAFESTHVIAEYALKNPMPEDLTFYDKNKYGPGEGGEIRFDPVEKDLVWEFLEKQIRANMAARGCIEPTFYHMGSDIRQSGDCEYLMSYMSQLGGRSILDYAVTYAGRRDKMVQNAEVEPKSYTEDQSSIWMRTGYASYLSSFMLINTGADYPWYGTEGNRGAAAWGFEPLQKGRTFFPGLHDVNNAPWPYDGEIDNGFIGALRTACAVFYRDDALGYMFLGGHAEEIAPQVYRLHPADGLRRRFHFRGDYGLSILTEGLRIESLEWDLERETVRVCLEGISEEDRGRVTFEMRDCAAQMVRAGEGVRQSGQENGKITAEIAPAGSNSDNGAKKRYWIELSARAEA